MKKRPVKTPEKGKQMARKEAVTNLRQILVRRRDALRQALAGDLSSLQELRQQTSGDMLDAAMDTAQDEINSQLAEVESRELSHIEIALERMRRRQLRLCAKGVRKGSPWPVCKPCPTPQCASSASEKPKKPAIPWAAVRTGSGFSTLGMADSEVSAGDLEIDA